MTVTTFVAHDHNTAAPEEEVVLVDEQDQCVGFAPKLSAHQAGGRLHRAFSVFIFNAAGKMLIQQRAWQKYHFGGHWTNTCCSHPRKDESVLQAAQRRLREEFGFNTELKEAFSFIYRAEDAQSGLTEHEYDHVVTGEFNGEPGANPQEIAAWKWVDVATLLEDVRANPQYYTPWFQQVLDQVLQVARPQSGQPMDAR